MKCRSLLNKHNDDDDDDDQCSTSRHNPRNCVQSSSLSPWNKMFMKIISHQRQMKLKECLIIQNTFNRDGNRRWSLRSMFILSLTIVASTVTGVKAGDDETLFRSNSWALILLKPAEVQSRRVWVTAAAQSHWISLHYFTRSIYGHRDTLWRI